MKRINRLMTLVAAIMLVACSTKEQKTIVIGHFSNAEDAPLRVYLKNAETENEVSLDVQDGTFMHEMASDKTTIFDLMALYQSQSFAESFIPDCDTVRFEIAEKVQTFYSDPASLNHQLEDFAAFQNDVFQRAQTDPECYSELMDYAMQMYENNKDNFIGYVGFMFASQGKEADEWEAMASQLSPELQQKPMIVLQRQLNEAKKKAAAGTMFRDFEATHTDGTMRHFSDYVGQGKYVLVDFWASWCGPCIRETPFIRAAYDKYNGEHFQVLGIAVSDERENTLRAISEHGIVWDVLMEAGEDPCDLYGFNTIPTIMLFGPDGTLLVRDGLRGDAIMDTLAVYLEPAL